MFLALIVNTTTSVAFTVLSESVTISEYVVTSRIVLCLESEICQTKVKHKALCKISSKSTITRYIKLQLLNGNNCTSLSRLLTF